jgi:hypothetical protein
MRLSQYICRLKYTYPINEWQHGIYNIHHSYSLLGHQQQRSWVGNKSK